MADIRASQIIAQIEYEEYPTYSVTGSGGVQVNGAGTSTFVKDVYTLVATGGVIANGEGTLTITTPVYTVVSTGGIEVNGAGTATTVVGLTYTYIANQDTWVVVEDDVPTIYLGITKVGGEGTVTFVKDVYSLVARGGIKADGEGIATFPTVPTTYSVTGDYQLGKEDVGVEINGVGTLTIPSLLYSLVATGGIDLSGYGDINFVEPVIKSVVAIRGVEISGIGATAFTTPETKSIVASGGLKVGDLEQENWIFPTVPTTYSVTGSGGVEIPEYPAIIRFITPVTWSLVGSGGVEVDYDSITEIYHTWVITGLNFEPSIYSGFDFNSYGRYKNRYYAAKSDGIYLLEGDDDDGTTIHPGIKIGPTHLGASNKKRIRAISMGEDNASCGVRVESEGNTTDHTANAKGKALISHDLKGDNHTIIIKDFSSIKLVEVDVVVLVK